MNALLALALLSAWPADVVTLINAEREQANLRELAIYGEIAWYREPLEYDVVLEASEQWWVDALKGSGWFSHSGWCNSRGYLIDPETGRQISRLKLPFGPDGHTDWNNRNAALGLFVNASENGALVKQVNAADVVEGWKRSGWSTDPRFATKHYFNLVLPQWKRIGVAEQVWGTGKRTVFAQFSQD